MIDAEGVVVSACAKPRRAGNAIRRRLANNKVRPGYAQLGAAQKQFEGGRSQAGWVMEKEGLRRMPPGGDPDLAVVLHRTRSRRHWSRKSPPRMPARRLSRRRGALT